MNHPAPDSEHHASRYRELIHAIFQPSVDITGGPRHAWPAAAGSDLHLCSRPEFARRIQHALYRADRSRQCFALVLLDIHWDSPPDLHTNTLIARRLRSCLRRGDSLSACAAGGFALLLEDLGDPDTLIFAMEKISDTLTTRLDRRSGRFATAVHAGISVFPEDGYQGTSLWIAAQDALQRSLLQPTGTIEFASHALAKQVREKREMSSALQHALQNREFELRYQPIVSADSGSVRRVETLLRWQHPLQGQLAAEVFLPALEESGLIIPVGQWVLDTACRQAQQLQASGHNAIQFSINLSERQLRDPGFIAYTQRLRGTGDLDPSRVEFECAESILLQNIHHARDNLSTLVGLGIPLTIDHFGCNSHALTELMRLPISGLKIDRGLIRRLPFDRISMAITGGILTFAHGVGIRASANGVETTGQLHFLRERACHEVQGRLIAQPMSFSELERWLPN